MPSLRVWKSVCKSGRVCGGMARYFMLYLLK